MLDILKNFWYNIERGEDGKMIKVAELTKEYYKSGEVAKMVGVSTRTIQNYCIRGRLPAVLHNNRRYVTKADLIVFLRENHLIDETECGRKDIIYCRVSTVEQEQRGDLDRQLRYVKDYVIVRNPKNLEIITDVSSGLDENRKGLKYLIHMVLNDEVDRIYVTFKDRLTRYGYNYLKMMCDYHHTEIVVLSRKSVVRTHHCSK